MEYEHGAGRTASLTLESHFAAMSKQSEETKKLESIWTLLKNDLEQQLQHTKNIFVTFSLHDSSHSRSILRNIERFLGADRIEQLSVTDTFMLLVCAYAHDLGMALTIEEVLAILRSDDFEKFIMGMDSSGELLEEEDKKAVRILAVYIRKELCKRADSSSRSSDSWPKLDVIYFAVITVIQMYIRPTHWKGVKKIEQQYKELLERRLNIRFVRNIVSICQAHGQDIHVLESLEPEADGFDGDVCHPRFIAAMLRLGDLLDVDNGRFPKWFFEAEARGAEFIPKLSDLHFKKHESISHLRIVPEYIAITSSCFSKGDDYDEEAYAVAETASEWFSWIRKDCEYLSKNWSTIAAGQFGAPPGELRLKVFVDGKPYFSAQQRLQMQIPQDRVMKLLEGTSIYQNRYVAVRELLQNAVDASLLQLWYDITHNVYTNIGIGKDTWQKYVPADGEKPPFPIWLIPSGVYENYKILVEVVWDKDRNQIRLVIKDRGIGITPEDVRYMARVGSSKSENPRIRKILKTMPDWLKPSGIFGIGLQSAFQLSSKLQFYTRRPNEPERHIIFHSYGKSRGQTEIRELPENPRGPFHDNAPQGTNVVLEVDIDKILPRGELDSPENFLSLDLKFTPKEPMETAYIIMSSVVQKELRAVNCDYFKVTFQNLIVENGLSSQQGRPIACRSSLFGASAHAAWTPLSLDKLMKEKTVYNFSNTTALYWDADTSRFFRLNIQPCKIENGCVQFPCSRKDLYRIFYKFNEISHVESLYGKKPDGDYLLNMERNGLVSWDILIMDGSPEKYMNIDRDRLKKGAIYEEQLLDIKRRILEKWCEFFVELGRSRPNQKCRTRFRDQQDILTSLMLLFYRYVPRNLFREFAQYYESALEHLCIKGYKYPLKKLWDAESKFATTYRLCGKKSKKGTPSYSLGPATVDLLSHRLFHIEQIYGTFSPKYNKITRIQYISHLGGDTTGIEAIEMDSGASLFDYMMVFDPTIHAPTIVLLESVIKKVFKPNVQYEAIITPTYPSSFRRGRNFCWRMDSSIRSFILSPFDDASFRILKKYLRPESDADLSSAQKEAFLSDIAAYFCPKPDEQPNSQQLLYCAKYVLHMRKECGIIPPDADDSTEIKKITGTYMAFIKKFCSTVFENFDLIMNQFKPSRDRTV